MGVPKLNVIGSREGYRSKEIQTAELKSLIREILGEEGGDFDHIMRKLCQIEELPEYDVLKSRALAVLKNWKEGLRKEKRNPNGRIIRYSLE